MSDNFYVNPKFNQRQTVRVQTVLDTAGSEFVKRAIASSGIQGDELTLYYVRAAREVGEALVAIHVSRWPEQDCPGYRPPTAS